MRHSHADDEIHVMSDSDSGGLRRTFSYSEQATEAVTKLFTIQHYSNPFQNGFHLMSFLAFIAYLLIGLGYYMGHQDYDFVDALYFCVTTIISIGYGDMEPGSTPERIFTSFYILLGLLILSAVISSISDKIHQNYVKQANERVKKAASRMRNLKAQGEQRNNMLDFLGVNVPLSPSDDNSSHERSFSKQVSDKLGLFPGSPEAEKYNEQKIVEAMQKLNMDMFDEDLQDLRTSATRNFVLVLVIIFFGCLVMLSVEEWNFGDSFYWAVVTISTVGFGDVVPTSDGGKIFTIFYCLVGVAVLARVMNDLIAYPLVKKEKQSELKVMMQFGGELSEDTLQHILTDDFFERVPNLRQKKDSISKSEFILLVLGMMNKVYDKDIIIVSKVFDMLDRHHEGALSSETIRHQMNTARLHEEKEQDALHLNSSISGKKSTKARSLPMSHVSSKLKEKVDNIKGQVASKSGGGKSGYQKVGGPGGMSNPLIDEDRSLSGELSEHSSKRGTYSGPTSEKDEDPY